MNLIYNQNPKWFLRGNPVCGILLSLQFLHFPGTTACPGCSASTHGPYSKNIIAKPCRKR